MSSNKSLFCSSLAGVCSLPTRSLLQARLQVIPHTSHINFLLRGEKMAILHLKLKCSSDLSPLPPTNPDRKGGILQTLKFIS